MRTHVNFTRVNKIEVTSDRPRVNVTVKRGSTFAFTRDLPYIAFILFTCVNITYVSTLKLRNSGNQPLYTVVFLAPLQMRRRNLLTSRDLYYSVVLFLEEISQENDL